MSDPQAVPHPRGSSQGGVRQYNERVVLQAVRQQGSLPAADIARATGLTAQTVSLITKRLLDEGLLRKGEPTRGKVGQPSVPLSLNPDGAYAIGIKVGRRSLDVLLVDFVGAVRQRWSLAYHFPEPAALRAEIGQRLQALKRVLGPQRHARVQGIGIAAPLNLDGWQSLLGVDAALAGQWHGVDLRAEVAALTRLPVELVKDTAAACVAELVAGRGRELPTFLYVFVDTFIGGGLVINGHLRDGRHGNAGAVGSLSLGLPRSARGADAPHQLLGVASLIKLEQRFQQAGLDITAVADARALQLPWQPHTEAWLREAAAAIALAVDAAACLLDLDGVLVDGSFSRELLAALLDALNTALDRYSWEGVARPPVLPGSIGSDARALGGAWLPLYAQFAPDRDLFLKAQEG
jgi:predicted NBD/HSP70 family sugar kinase